MGLQDQLACRVKAITSFTVQFILAASLSLCTDSAQSFQLKQY
jgi:hypothetical protein